MTSYLLPGRAINNPIHEITAKEQGFSALVSTWIVTEPVLLAPSVLGTNYVGVLDALHHFAALKEEMAYDAPGGGNIELLEQSKQAVDHGFSLDLARLRK